VIDKIGDWMIALLYVAGIFVLVRPGSQGPAFVTAITDGTSNLVKAATGGGTWGDGG
jgi:hypothetical protein